MVLNYHLEEKDYLAYQLYNASASARISKKRRRSRVIVPVLYTAASIYFGLISNFPLLITFCVISLLWYFIYPLWERRHYVNHYAAFIRENYGGKIGRNIVLEINNDAILAKSDGSESRVMTKEIQEIVEIPSNFFIRITGGQAFILPKDKLCDVGGLVTDLKLLAAHLGIEYIDKDKWEWR